MLTILDLVVLNQMKTYLTKKDFGIHDVVNNKTENDS